jgi:Signal transduction histidine kinase
MPRTPFLNTAPPVSSAQAGSSAASGLDFAALLDVSPDAIIVYDRDFRVIYSNPKARRISQLDADGSIGQIYWDIRPQSRGTIVEENFLATMRDRVPRQFEFYCAPIDVWMDILVTPFADGVAAFYKDISASKLNGQTRDTATKRLQQTFDATPDSIVCLDRDWNFTFANWRAVDLLGSGPLVGDNLWRLFPHNALEPFNSNYRKTMESRIPTEFEAFYPEPLNTWYRVFARPFEDGIIIFFSDITARKLAEQRRDQLIRQLDQVFEVTTDAIIGIDRDWRFTFMNVRAKAILSPNGDLLGKNIWEEFPAALSTGFQSNYERTMLDRVPSTFEAFYPDPLNLWFNILSLPSDDGIIVFFRDITQERRDQAALRESEARYRVLADLNPQAIWMGDANGKITYANHGFSDYLGFTTADLDHWITAFHPDDRTRVFDTWADCISTGVEYDLEARLIRARDGMARWWWIRARPIRDASGSIQYWLGVAIDIDDRKTFAEMLVQKQAETERQRAELETIYDTAPVGLALFDPVEFRYLRVNDHQAKIIGLPKERIIGHSITEIAPIPGLKELFQQVAAGNPVRNHILEGELPTRPGQRRHWSVNYSPVYAANGEVEAIAAVVVEITHQKKAENALIQSEKLAAVGRLASSISHEINNPLEAITNLLYLINLSDDLSPGARDYLHTAQSELSRVCQIATQTLRFHRQAVRATHVTAADLVDAVLNLYQGRLANSSIKVEAAYSTTARILCFENDIRQVLNNLIANAIDAMRQGGRLVVRAHDATDHSEGSRKRRQGIRITIADTGHGMSAEVRERLFEPFYTTKDLNGTGLGLWISAGIVSRHQGRLSFRSTQHPTHHGTIFSLFLPWAEEPSPPIPESPST